MSQPFFQPATNISLRPTICVNGPPTDLRALAPSSLLTGGMLAFTATSGFFAFDAASLDADDGVLVIKPNDIAIGDPGRWKKIIDATGPLEPYTFKLDGSYGNLIGPAVQKWFTFDGLMYVQTARTISNVTLTRRTPGSGGQTQVTVEVNGNPIFAGPNRPVVLASAGTYASASSSTFIPGSNVLAPGDIVEVLLTEADTVEPNDFPESPEGICVTIEF